MLLAIFILQVHSSRMLQNNKHFIGWGSVVTSNRNSLTYAKKKKKEFIEGTRRVVDGIMASPKCPCPNPETGDGYLMGQKGLGRWFTDVEMGRVLWIIHAGPV